MERKNSVHHWCVASFSGVEGLCLTSLYVEFDISLTLQAWLGHVGTCTHRTWRTSRPRLGWTTPGKREVFKGATDEFVTGSLVSLCIKHSRLREAQTDGQSSPRLRPSKTTIIHAIAESTNRGFGMVNRMVYMHIYQQCHQTSR